ncbi:MAG TPA: hypothetical protein VK674_06950 [Candidatus Limnocylindria bacterium]|nr:hypothetical protein [Candidatus Limnocylindria bacterium]
MIKNSPIRTRYLPGIIVVVMGMWSWLFSIRVAALSPSLIIGYFCTLLGFLTIVGITTALFVAVIMYFAREYQAKAPSPWFPAKLFVVWAAMELGASLLVSVIWIGRNGSLDSVLPFGSFAPLLAFTPFGFLARFVGFHGLSAAFVVLASTLAFKKLRKYAPMVTGILLVGAVSAWALYRAPVGQPVNVQIVAEQGGASSPLPSNSDLVILPEYGLNSIKDAKISSKLITNSDREVFYIGSRRQEVQGGAQNVLVFGSTRRGVIQERAKTRLIPGGEYLPYLAEIPLRLAGAQKTTLEQFKFARAIEKGTEKATPLAITSDIRLGSGVCASIIAPKDYRGLAKDGATLLTNSAALGAFRSPLFTLQHEGLARFMAVANSRPFLQSSSDGLAFAIDHNGRLLKKTTPVSSAELTVHSNNKKTPYTYLGEWPAYTGLGLLLLGLIRHVLTMLKKLKVRDL